MAVAWDHSGLSCSLTNIFSFKTVGKIVLEIPIATSEMLSSYYPIISQLEGQHKINQVAFVFSGSNSHALILLLSLSSD